MSLVALNLTAMPLSATNECADTTVVHSSHELRNVTVTSSRRQHSNALQTVPTQYLDRNAINDLGIESVAEAMRQFAGVSVKDYGGIGGMKTVSVRNLGAAHTAVSYDGITVSNTQAGQIDIGRFSLDNVSLLSLSIGHSNDIMQTARHYASAGVMAIETERPHFGKHPYSVRVKIKGGSWGQFSPQLRYWQRLGKNTSLAFDGSMTRADGIYPFTLKNGRLVTREKRYNSDITSWQGELNLYHTFADSSQLDVKAYGFHSERGLPGVVVLYNPTTRERLWDENFFGQVSWTKHLARQWKLKVRGKYTHSWNRYEDYNVKYTGGVMSDVNRQDEYYMSSTLGWTPLKGFSMSLAEDLSINTLRTNINGSPNPLRFTSLTALAARYRYGRFTAEGNIVGTYTTEHITIRQGFIGNEPDDRKKLSPSLSVSFRLLPQESLYLRAMMKNTFRVPTFNDLYYLRIGNTSLHPERANEYGVGVTWNMRPQPWLRYLSITVDGYYNNVRDKIVAFPSTYIWKMVNFGKVDIYGLDATMATEVPFTKQISLSVAGSFTYQDARNKTEDDVSYNSQLPYTPKTTGSLSTIIKTPWLTLGYTLTGQGRRYSMDQNIKEYEIESYVEHSLSASHQFVLKRSRLSLQLSIHNLTDRQYEIIKYYPMPGRSWTASATWTW